MFLTRTVLYRYNTQYMTKTRGNAVSAAPAIATGVVHVARQTTPQRSLVRTLPEKHENRNISVYIGKLVQVRDGRRAHHFTAFFGSLHVFKADFCDFRKQRRIYTMCVCLYVYCCLVYSRAVISFDYVQTKEVCSARLEEQ